jgi:hypothetical protein
VLTVSRAPLKTPEDCALAYADLLDDVDVGRLTPAAVSNLALQGPFP